MFKVELIIKGQGVKVTVTKKDTGESRTEYTTPIFFLGEEKADEIVENTGRAKAERMIKLWKIELSEPKIVEYEVD